MNYTVTNALKTGNYDSKFGPMVKYTVQFEGMEDAVELSQKPDTAAPKAGDTLEGIIEATQYGKKFKKAQGTSNGFSRGQGKSPEEMTSIQRQVALKAAVEAVRDWYSTKDEVPDLKGHVANIINTAVAFERHLESGAPMAEPKEANDTFDAATAVTDVLGGEEVPF